MGEGASGAVPSDAVHAGGVPVTTDLWAKAPPARYRATRCTPGACPSRRIYGRRRLRRGTERRGARRGRARHDGSRGEGASGAVPSDAVHAGGVPVTTDLWAKAPPAPPPIIRVMSTRRRPPGPAGRR